MRAGRRLARRIPEEVGVVRLKRFGMCRGTITRKRGTVQIDPPNGGDAGARIGFREREPPVDPFARND